MVLYVADDDDNILTQINVWYTSIIYFDNKKKIVAIHRSFIFMSGRHCDTYTTVGLHQCICIVSNVGGNGIISIIILFEHY